MSDIRQALNQSRLELLDMGLRGNTLLHFKHGARTLEIVDEKAEQVFEYLVEKRKAMSFLPVPQDLLKEDEREAYGNLPLPSIFEERFGDKRHEDNKLQTRLGSDALDKRLIKISNEANTYYQEQGVDLLYLALGFLTWYEDTNSTKARSAPLVLVPVSLSRGSARERFSIEYTEADIGPNLSLAAKLKMEFSLKLPEFPDDFHFNQYLEAVAKQVSDMPRWSVDTDTIGLGFFSFGKFQMYQDLDPDNWPKDKHPADHSLLQKLIGEGFESDQNALDATEQKPMPFTELHLVKDSDSSQTAAVAAVKNGVNLVIQGPPGTGKSQTITNIIGEALADNKRVLFVAEKMAALEVVKRRLDECHLGDAVLELHSHKSNKAAVLEELKRTLVLGEPDTPDRASEKARHRELQTQLDTYSEAVNTPVLNSGISYVEALGKHLKAQKSTQGHHLPDLGFEWMKNWTPETFTQAKIRIDELIAHLKAMGIPKQNSFANIKRQDFSPIEQKELSLLISKAQRLTEEVQMTGFELSSSMQLEAPATLPEAKMIHRAATRAIEAPHLKGLTLTTDDWQQRRESLQALIAAGKQISDTKAKHQATVIDQGWQADLLTARQAYVTKGDKWWRFASGDYRRAKAQLQGLMKAELPETPVDCLALIDDILQVQTQTQTFQQHAALGERLFGAQWQGEKNDWPVLKSLTDWVINLYESVGKGELPEGLIRFLQGDHTLATEAVKLETLKKATAELTNTLAKLQTLLTLDLPMPLTEQPLIDLLSQLQHWDGHLDALYQMTRFNQLQASLNANGLEKIATLAYDWAFTPDYIWTAVELTYYGGLVNTAYSQHDAIKQFDRISHEGAIEQFKQLDHALFDHAQESLAHRLHERLPSINAGGEVGIIRHEMNKKRRHMPMRKLIQQAGRAMQQIKPVFMMSPMSIATYLAQGAVDFDLVVFDEASQVKVVDALGAILRGHQVVVVGDTKQMPPTDFFGKSLELDDEEAEQSHTADIESILSLFLSKGAPESMLRWHYRSRHDSLINVSNQEFYDGKLMIFPSPGVNPDATGLDFAHTPEAIYERGSSRTNPIEARKVAEAVMHHARTKPELTLGVVAFSTAQRDCILLEIERLRREDDSLEDFFVNDNLEGFFVKNLENVQGDERDTIFISIGYGRTSSGNVSTSFGPVNRKGGHRRLNVLITRARIAMTVFANFTADELKTTESSPFGVKAMKNFLHYAEKGQIPQIKETGKETDSPFEDEVISAIRHLGYEAEPQIGSAGFFIDMGVRDPEKPGRYLLAVECDGATYHSSANARDRDRLRQAVLEGMGWRFHRIWSTDWFRNAHKETERLKEAIEESINYYKQFDEQAPEPKATAPVKKPRSITRKTLTEKGATNVYQLVSGDFGLYEDLELHEQPLDELVQALKKVVDTEGAIAISEATKRLAESMGLNRIGNRISTSIDTAIEYGVQETQLYKRGDFLYPDTTYTAPIRDRSQLPASLKKIECVPPQEIQAALLSTIKMAFSLSEENAMISALSMMGFQRATAKAKTEIHKALLTLKQQQRVVEKNGMLTLAVNKMPTTEEA